MPLMFHSVVFLVCLLQACNANENTPQTSTKARSYGLAPNGPQPGYNLYSQPYPSPYGQPYPQPVYPQQYGQPAGRQPIYQQPYAQPAFIQPGPQPYIQPAFNQQNPYGGYTAGPVNGMNGSPFNMAASSPYNGANMSPTNTLNSSPENSVAYNPNNRIGVNPSNYMFADPTQNTFSNPISSTFSSPQQTTFTNPIQDQGFATTNDLGTAANSYGMTGSDSEDSNTIKLNVNSDVSSTGYVKGDNSKGVVQDNSSNVESGPADPPPSRRSLDREARHADVMYYDEDDYKFSDVKLYENHDIKREISQNSNHMSDYSLGRKGSDYNIRK